MRANIYAMTEDSDSLMKQRVTFYAPKTVMDVIEKVKIDRNDSSITDAVCQIIIEYGIHRNMKELEKNISCMFDEAAANLEIMKSEHDSLRNRLALAESKYASLSRAVAEIQAPYKKK